MGRACPRPLLGRCRAALTVAAAVAHLPAAVDHVLLTEQQLLASDAVPCRLDGAHRAEGLHGGAGVGAGGGGMLLYLKGDAGL